jgi:23S rRNA pseudouridine1911/1915/1917 synthase
VNPNPTHPSNDVFVVSGGEDGLRLDVFCASRLQGISRSRIQKLIKTGAVTVDSARRPASHAVKSGEAVRIEIPAPAADGGEPAPQAIPLRIVFEDDDIIVVNKHAGIVVHPAAGNPDGTVVNAVLGRGTRLSGIGGRDRPGVVHRLDKDTSGLLVLAKTDRAYRALAEQIGARRVRKIYHAIVWGHLGAPSRRIDAPIARHPVERKKMAVAERGGRSALTEAFVVDTFAHFAYIRVNIVTGRTHQIRVHLAHISHPILGDPVYGGRRPRGTGADPGARARLGAIVKMMHRQALHASAISFEHPVTGEPAEFATALPDDMRSVLEELYRRDKL